jgi:hypothetical protein
MGALSVLSLKNNNLATKEAGAALAMALVTNSILRELDVSNNVDGVIAASTKTDGPGFAQELAVGIKDNGTMTSLDVSSNTIGLIDIFPDDWRSRDDDGQAPFIHAGGREQNVVPEGANSSAVIALANAIKDMGAMSKFTFSGDSSWSKPVTMETTMTEADFSDKDLGASGAILLAAFLPKCL